MDNNLQTNHEPLYTDWPGARFKEPILYGDASESHLGWGSRRFDVTEDLVRMGKFGINADSWFGRLCQFADWLEDRDLLTHSSSYPSVTFGGRHFSRASLAAHIAYFAAANYPYGISPASAEVTGPEWVEGNIDLFHNAYVIVNKYGEEFEEGPYLSGVDRNAVPFPPLAWLAHNNHQVSLAFSHHDGVDCLHRALGIGAVKKEDDRMMFRAVVDSIIGGTLHNVDPMHAHSPWTTHWCERDDYTLGHLLWRSLMLVRDELRKIFTKDGFHQAALMASSHWHNGHSIGKHNVHRLNKMADEAKRLAAKHKQLKKEAC